MSLRPASANWFELLVMRDDLAAAMKVLASSRCGELQSHGEARAPMRMPECRELLEDFDELERRFRHHWPPPSPHEHDERAELIKDNCSFTLIVNVPGPLMLMANIFPSLVR